MVKIENYIVKKDLGIVLANRSFKELTTMKVGGKIKCLYYPNSIENLLDVILYLNQNGKRFFVLGNGSNIIASDRTFKDLVICGKHLDFEVIYQSDSFIVSAFSDLRKINSKLLQKNISTFLNLTGIPATIGGAIVMNAGAFGSNISDHLIWVECIKDGKVIKIYKKCTTSKPLV